MSAGSTDAIVVLCTVGSTPDADRIAAALVERRLAACVHVMPAGVSTYRWQGVVEQAQEHQLVIKTAADRFEDLRAALVELHPYDVPELIALPVTQAHAPYLAWLLEHSRP
ncbi:MAG: divalent-cation tolerance protein CutA [Vicinamibacteria bacterium]|nr:divalent-cation tolerance protein CutA [Vicinamibacteria bacterium]